MTKELGRSVVVRFPTWPLGPKRVEASVGVASTFGYLQANKQKCVLRFIRSSGPGLPPSLQEDMQTQTLPIATCASAGSGHPDSDLKSEDVIPN